MLRIEKIPPSIAAAIAKVQAGIIASVPKDQNNTFGKYKFTSTDQVYGALSQKLAAAGLVILCLEGEPPVLERVEKDGKTAQWCRFVFNFVLATPEDTWSDDTSRRTLYVQITGPQSFMAAQSFAEKSFLRSLFKLATGDVDLDAYKQADTEEDQVALADKPKKKRKSSAAAKRDGTAEVFEQLKGTLEDCNDFEALQKIRTKNAEIWEEMPPEWAGILDGVFEDKIVAFGRDLM